MELRQYFSVLMRWLWLIVLGTVLAAGTAYIVSANMAPVYQATTTLFISQAANPSSPTALDYSSILGSQSLAKTYSELLKKRPVLGSVIDTLGLQDDKGKKMLPEALVQLITVTPVRDTMLLQVAIEHTNPELAASIANKVAATFIEQTNAMQVARYADSKQSLEKQLTLLDQDIKDAQKALDAARASTTLGPVERQNETIRLENAITTYRSSYANLLKSYEDLRLAEARTVDNVIIAETAQRPINPVRPNKTTNTLLAAVVGLMLAVGVAFLIEYLDDTIKSPDELAQALGVSTLGIISRTPPVEKDADRLITAAHPKSHISEAYRVLRTNIQFAGVNKALRTLLVTSANPTEGKTTTLANLGVVMAQAGTKVIMVDSDLRRPMLHKIFEVPNTTGLTNLLLQDDLVLDGHIADTKIENLRLITSGPLPPNPSELLSSQRMKRLVETLKGQADMILFDTPPILPVTDAAVLASATDGVMMVVDAGSTRRDVAARASEMLRQVGANVVGGALNKLRPGRAGGYYYYYHYYYYTPEGERKPRHRPENGGDPLEPAQPSLTNRLRNWVQERR